MNIPSVTYLLLCPLIIVLWIHHSNKVIYLLICVRRCAKLFTRMVSFCPHSNLKSRFPDLLLVLLIFSCLLGIPLPFHHVTTHLFQEAASVRGLRAQEVIRKTWVQALIFLSSHFPTYKIVTMVPVT